MPYEDERDTQPVLPSRTPEEDAGPAETRDERMRARNERLAKLSAVRVLKAIKAKGYWWPGG